jgi:hypothetical protein
MAWVALITWLVTAGLGFYMLATWARAGGVRSGPGGASHFPPPVVFGHFLLAAAGLVVWIIYVATDQDALSWVALVILVLVAGLGDVLVLRWLRDRRAGTAASTDPLAGSGTTRAGTTSHAADATALAEQRIPTAVVAAHGVFAVATILLVLLVALGVGS